MLASTVIRLDLARQQQLADATVVSKGSFGVGYAAGRSHRLAIVSPQNLGRTHTSMARVKHITTQVDGIWYSSSRIDLHPGLRGVRCGPLAVSCAITGRYASPHSWASGVDGEGERGQAGKRVTVYGNYCWRHGGDSSSPSPYTATADPLGSPRSRSYRPRHVVVGLWS